MNLTWDQLLSNLAFKCNLRHYWKVTADYALLTKAAADLKDCKHFVTVLEGILAVGNHLNGGTYNGQAGLNPKS